MSLFGNVKVSKDYIAPKTSVYGIQNAGVFKRFAAFMLDTILCIIIAVGVARITTGLLKYDDLSSKLEEKYIEFGVASYDEEGYLGYCEIPILEDGNYDLESDCYKAYELFNADEEAASLMVTSVQYTLVMIGVGALVATAITFFVFPLIFKNGQTLGMKLTQCGLVTNKGIRVQFGNVFLRWSMGIYVIETMLPIYLFVYALLVGNYISIIAIFLMLLMGLEVITYAVTPNHIFLHDLISGTVVIDMNTQVIANSLEEYEGNIKREQEALNKEAL